ncbi:MAG: UDP-N-acetyl-D-glucosamine dehydrogenase [Deltaproteobacteria bacterium RIFCSPHIGHO2_02_FULL_60_17]|nr:MAG: UDP-N-acetyl-D-glucosamine dehydrogenase [Deltaproteobacteria bacterium RIFCSPHIGHO2_02_FULL_60_17]
MTTNKETLLHAIEERKAKVCVLGLGYVGLPLAVRFTEAGYPVVGIDVDKEKIEKIQKGLSYVPGVSLTSSSLRPLRASTDTSLLREADVSIICVPTPLSKTRDPDLSLVLEAGRTIAQHLHPGQLVVLESTTYPGTTRELLLPLFEEKGLGVGKDFYLAYSPERIDPGNESFNLVNTPKVVAGITPSCAEAVQKLYSQIVTQVVTVSSTDTAEMVKLLENTFRSINIALVNEFAIMCHRLGLNVWEVIAAAASKPFGFMPFYPGPGLGGHCIPVDPHYLSWKLKLLAYKARLIELADEINREMPRFVVEKIVEALNRAKKSVKGSRILILGVAYKKDSDDVRESPALDVMKLLGERGGEIAYHDPHVSQLRLENELLQSAPLTSQSLASADVVVIITDHTKFDAGEIVGHSRLIIDARNLTHGIESEKIVRL